MAGRRVQSILTKLDQQPRPQVTITECGSMINHIKLSYVSARPTRRYTTNNDKRREYLNNNFVEDNEPTTKKYFKKTNKDYYDPFSFQSTQRSPAVEKYLQYKASQHNDNVYSNRLDSRLSIQVPLTHNPFKRSVKCLVSGIKLHQLQEHSTTQVQASEKNYQETCRHLL